MHPTSTVGHLFLQIRRNLSALHLAPITVIPNVFPLIKSDTDLFSAIFDRRGKGHDAIDAMRISVVSERII